MADMERMIRAVNSLARSFPQQRQIQLLENISTRLGQGTNPDRLSRLPALANDFDAAQEHVETVLSNPATAAKGAAALQGDVGEAITRLDFTTVEDKLDDINAQLKEMNGKLDTVASNTSSIKSDTTGIKSDTSDIKAAIQQERVSPAKLASALEVADMTVLNLATSSQVAKSTIEEPLRQRSADGRASVAERFFTASSHSPEALKWFDQQLSRGLDPDLLVAGDYYKRQALLAEALHAGNVDAVQILLHHGASPHPYQEIDLTPYPKTRFAFPLLTLAENNQLTLDQKKQIAQAMLAAGAVIPNVAPARAGSWQSEMYVAHEQQGKSDQLGVPLTPTPTICEKTQSPICQQASKRFGVNWCARIAAMPKEIKAPLDGADRPFYDVKLRYLLFIDEQRAYFLGFDSGRTEYVIVSAASDNSNWTVLSFTGSTSGGGTCRSEDNYQPPDCWHPLAFTRVGQTNVMRGPLGDSWTLSQHGCEDAPVTGVTSISPGAAAAVSSVPRDSGSAPRKSGESVPGNRYRVSLLMLKDNPELLDKYGADMARMLLYGEATARAELARVTQDPPQEPGYNSSHPAFVFEWSELAKSNPSFARGAALDVYLQPEQPWQFLERTPGWDPQRPHAWTGMFLFPSSAENNNRDSAFAAHDVLPILKEQLLLAAAREPADLWFSTTVGDAHYDIDAQRLVFKTELAEPTRLNGSLGDGKPVAAYNMVKLQTAAIPEPQTPAGGYRKNFPELERWRALMGLRASVTNLALDRKLLLPPIALDRQKAEALHLGSGPPLKARIFVRAGKVESNPGTNDRYAMFAVVTRVEIVSNAGELLATVNGSSLPQP